MRIDFEISDKLEDNLLNYMAINKIKSRSEAVRIIIESFFAGERMFESKVLPLLYEIRNALIKK